MTTPLFTTRFNRDSTAAEVLAGVDLGGRRAVVTGGASGIGLETARALSDVGASVTLAVRDTAAGRRAADELSATTRAQVGVAALDLADQASVAAFAAAWDGPLDILVANAGVMALPRLQRTADGWEVQFATNYYGHFGLATRLHTALAAADGARVVSVSSSAHLGSPVVLDDIHFERREYDPWMAYGQSKTANVLFAVGAASRWSDDGIAVNALMPGAIRTNLQRHITEEMLDRIREQVGAAGTVTWKTAQQGAATSVLLAGSPVVDGVTGRYFEDCNEAGPHVEGTRTGVAGFALDPVAARALWEISEAAVRP